MSDTDVAQQAECLRRLDVQTLMSLFPWRSWLNEHFYWIPSLAETSAAIAVVDGINSLIACLLSSVITFCVSRRRRKMYCGHARLSVCVSVCLSVALRLHYCTDPDVTWGVVEAAP